MSSSSADINPVNPYADVAEKPRGAEPISDRRQRQQREKPKKQPKDVVEIHLGESQEDSEDSIVLAQKEQDAGLDISA